MSNSSIAAFRRNSLFFCALVMLLKLSVIAQERKSIAEALYPIIAQKGVQEAASLYRRLKKSQQGEYDFSEPQLNRLGYRLLRESKHKEALVIFELNIEAFPQSANAYDSLAEACMWMGDVEKSVRLYEKVLAVAESDKTTSAETLSLLKRNAGRIINQYRKKKSGEGEILSPRIAALKAKLLAGDKAAVDRFLQEIKSTAAPMIETFERDFSQSLVTFLWFADREVKHILIQSLCLGDRDPARNKMDRLLDTKLWYRTYQVPKGLKCSYLFSPDDRRLSLYADLMSDSLLSSTLALDPLNPRKFFGEQGRYWSVLELPDARAQPWATRHDGIPAGEIDKHTFKSRILGNDREVRVYKPAGYRAGQPYGLLVFFDGFTFLEMFSANVILDNLIASKKIPPVIAVFAYNPSDEARRFEMACHPPTNRFLSEELIPWIRSSYKATPRPEDSVIIGVSRSGLGAAFAGFELSNLFGNVLSLSGSFWWSPRGEETEWLARQFTQSRTLPLKFHLDVGRLENSVNPQTGLNMQTVSRHLRDVLMAKGYKVSYREFSGGHDPLAWQGVLGEGLINLIGQE
ncbi:MAG: alpha/beta hydrolase-fold protein [Acidobacteriota bacterium]